MRRILFLAHHFPPIGGGGVQRNAKLARYLPDFGYEPVVITGPGGASGRWTPSDATLSADIRSGTEIWRLSDPAPPRTGWRDRVERWLMLPSGFRRWLAPGAVELAKEHADVELVYASLVPYESAEPALAVAEALGKPLVVDLQDPWALDEMWLYPTGLHRRRDLRRMRRVFRRSHAVVMNTPEAVTRVLRRFPELDPQSVFSIPNGFDAADFEGPAPERSDDAFRIVHTGFLYTEDGLWHRRTRRIRRILGGTAFPVDFLTRSHVYVMDALDRLFKESPELAGTVEFHLVGVLGEADRDVISGRRFVRTHGYLSHEESVAIMRSADLLFLPMQDLPPGTRAGLVPGKTYEYLASERPILAAVPDGDARDLLTELGTALLSRPADSEAMMRIILGEIERKRAGRPGPLPRGDVVARYERRAQAGQLADVFNEVLGLSAVERNRRSVAATRG